MIYPRPRPMGKVEFALLTTVVVIEGAKIVYSLFQGIRKRARQKGQEHCYKFLVK